VRERSRQSWVRAEPNALAREREAMLARAPEMTWQDQLTAANNMRGAGWEGLAPAWGAERPRPPGVDELLDGRQLRLQVVYREGFPMVPPVLVPLDPEPPMERRTQHYWHVNPDGSLCLLRSADNWQLTATAADLVCKASGWLIEYFLVEANLMDGMTARGIYASSAIDPILAKLAQ